VSEFSVTPGAVSEAGARLGALSGGIEEAIGRIASCSGAAGNTPLHGAFEGMLGHWGSVLPHFGSSGERLSGALAGAAAAYSTVERSVGESAAVNAGSGS
jgi:hypothetical protein